MNDYSPTIYEFNGYLLDEVRKNLFYRGVEIRLTNKNFDVLNLLVKNAGYVVDKKEFHETVWSDTFVEDGNLAVSINNLRKIFETYSKDTFIETYSRRGYKFTAQINKVNENREIPQVNENREFSQPEQKPPLTDKVRILIADDHPIFRRGLRSMIESDLGLEVIGEAGNGQMALEIIKTLKPEIVILDNNMPLLSGVEAAKIIYQEFPQIKVICLTLEITEEIVRSLKQSKVKGYVLKENAVSEIVICIKQVVAGRVFMSSEILELFIIDEE